MRRQDFRNPSDARTDDVQATTRSFDDDGAEGLGETGMQVDMTSHHHISHLLMPHGSEEFDSILQDAPFEHLLEVDGFGSGAGDDEADVWVAG